MVACTHMEQHIQKTLVIVKPDGVQRALVGEIITRFERVGLKLIAIKMVHPDTETVRQHYTINPGWKQEVGEKLLRNREKKGEDTAITPLELGERVLGHLTNFMTAGPVVTIALEGAHAVPLTRKLVGTTEPLSSDVGTIRGDYVLDSYDLADGDGRAIRNIVHASSSPEDAEKELQLWFKKEELMGYRTAHEYVLYDVNFDNVAE